MERKEGREEKKEGARELGITQAELLSVGNTRQCSKSKSECVN